MRPKAEVDQPMFKGLTLMFWPAAGSVRPQLGTQSIARSSAILWRCSLHAEHLVIGIADNRPTW